MASLKFHKVTVLPGTLEADAFYFVENNGVAEGYLTDSAATAKAIGNSTLIQSIADQRVNAALADLNTVEIVADIAARDATIAAAERNLMILVLDASADATVDAGAALYAYRHSDQTTVKVCEYESMDVVVAWEDISGRPTSAPSLIDDAVTKRHSHTNKATLDKIGEAGGNLTFNGSAVSADWNTQNW